MCIIKVFLNILICNMFCNYLGFFLNKLCLNILFSLDSIILFIILKIRYF